MRPSRVRPFTCFLTFAVASLLAHAQTLVPYIGCPGDGQTGPDAAAKGEPKRVDVSPATASQLAWYEYNGDAGRFGMLGPRGWNCFATIGSSGWTLYIAPDHWTAPNSLNTRTGRVSQGQPFSFPAPTAELQVASKLRKS